MKSDVLKQKVRHELIEYAINVVYLALVFAAFIQYRRLVLASHEIVYTNYWFPVIEALVLGKVIMIGSVFHLGQGLENKPLVYSTVYKTFVFIVFVGLFKVVEHAVRALWNGEGIASALVEFAEVKGPHEILAGILALVVAFIPFFAFKELVRVFGRERIWALFFRNGLGKGIE